MSEKTAEQKQREDDRESAQAFAFFASVLAGVYWWWANDFIPDDSMFKTGRLDDLLGCFLAGMMIVNAVKPR